MTLPAIGPGAGRDPAPPTRPGARAADSPGMPAFDALLRVLRPGVREEDVSPDAGPADPAAPLARMFNQDGFFAGPLAAGGDGAADPAAAAAGPDPALPVLRTAAADGPAGTGAAISAGTPLHSDRAAAALRAPAPPGPGAMARAAAPLRGSAGPPGPGGAADAGGRPALAETFESAMPARRAHPRAGASPGANVNLVLRLDAAGEELNLSVRLARLTREQRERLRAEIERLLADHGFVPGEIRLNGLTGPERPGQEGG